MFESEIPANILRMKIGGCRVDLNEHHTVHYDSI